jgi:Concanavalin A-like lectin/glucanases superfamily
MKSAIRVKFIKMAALFCLALGVLVVSCSKSSTPPTPTNKTTLQMSVDSANWYATNTTEGTKPGEYTVGAKATLATATASATAILNDASSTQTELDNAAANLNAAITTYKAAYIQQIAAANLIAYWKFNGNANDSSGNGHNGTVTLGHAFFGAGTPTLTADRFGNANDAYHFDKGGNIDIPFNAAFNTQQMSISLWARLDTAGRTVNPANCYMVSFDRWNGWKFQTQPFLPFYTVHAFESAATPPDTTYYDRDDAGTALTPGTTWYHLVVTFKPGEEDFYINGALVKSWTNTPGTPITVSAPPDITIGSDLPTSAYSTDPNNANYVNYGGFWKGDLDDVMFYNIALTAPQVTSIFNDQNTQ